jgi:hypothetical protein
MTLLIMTMLTLNMGDITNNDITSNINKCNITYKCFYQLLKVKPLQVMSLYLLSSIVVEANVKISTG